MQDKIIDRIRKLLALSKSANEHEAAAAAAKASQLMREHEIGEAMLRVEDDSRSAEDIVEGTVDGSQAARKRVAWKCFIASGAALAFGVKMWTTSGKIVGLGRVSAVQSWGYTCQYLYREVDRLADEAWDSHAASEIRIGAGGVRAWKNAFRVGASHAIHLRLKAQAEESEASKRADVAALCQSSESGTQALAVIDRDRSEVAAAYAERSKGFSKVAGIGQTSSRSGYASGVAAGRSVSLGGGARAGLPEPSKRIR